MSKEEIFRYIFSCVSFNHMFDLSPRITDSAQKKEDLLFSSAVFFLMELSKNKNVFVEDIKKESTMKEVTYEDWKKNPTPRMMWVWDDDEEDRKQQKVVYVIKGEPCRYPVRITINDDTDYEACRHCAEIEKQRRMTNKELSRWLREKPTREYKFKNSDFVYGEKNYREIDQDDEVKYDIFIREGDSDWREPLVEE